tara:strand:- start:1258 stop:2289 length:1032 start_codon:yes stop_codon:yes gene_type:complete
LRKTFQKLFVTVWGAFALSLVLGNAFAQSQSYSGSDGYDASYRSPLDLVSKITEVDITLEKGSPVKSQVMKSQNNSQFKGKGYEPSRHSPLDLVSKITTEQIPVQKSGELPRLDPQRMGFSNTAEGFEDAEDPFADEHPEYPQISDPFEGYNRFMHSVNDGLFEYLMEPVARNYAEFLHDDIRLAIRNLFSNVGAPLRLVSSILQGDVDKTVRVFGRFILNSTVGIGGLFDVAANYYEVEPVNEDFEQALGHFGVGSGPYFVLPFLGPSSARNVVGKVIDSFLSPMIIFAPGFSAGAAMNATEIINSLSFHYKGYSALKNDSVDPYISMRDFQHQYREKLIHE